MISLIERNRFAAALVLVIGLGMITAAYMLFGQTAGDMTLAVNSFLTTQQIARETLLRLRNMLVMRGLVHVDFKNEFAKQGDTIRVKKPPTYTANEFTSTITTQGITEDSVSVVLDKIADVSVDWTSKERALNLADFGEQFLNPAAEAIAQKMDADILKTVYKDVPYYIGTSGTTPDGLDDFANARKMLNINKVPMANRYGVWSPDADAKFSILDAIVHAEKSGSTQALREGSIGRIQGIDNFMSQNVVSHVAGGFTAATAPKVKTLAVVGESTINLKSSSGTGKLLKGDLIKIGSDMYVVTADTADAATNAIDAVPVYPKIKSAYAVDTAVVFPDATAAGHVANLVFHKNAFAFVQRPLEPPMGGAESYTVNFEGLSLRVTAGYDISTKKEIVSLDLLYGIKTIYNELAVRVLG